MPVPSGTTKNLNRISSSFDLTNTYIVGDSGTIIRRGTTYKTWSSYYLLPSPISDNLVDIVFKDSLIFVLSDKGKIIKSTDGGGSWIVFATNPDDSVRFGRFYLVDSSLYVIGNRKPRPVYMDPYQGYLYSYSLNGELRQRTVFPRKSLVSLFRLSGRTIIAGNIWSAGYVAVSDSNFCQDLDDQGYYTLLGSTSSIVSAPIVHFSGYDQQFVVLSYYSPTGSQSELVHLYDININRVFLSDHDRVYYEYYQSGGHGINSSLENVIYNYRDSSYYGVSREKMIIKIGPNTKYGHLDIAPQKMNDIDNYWDILAVGNGGTILRWVGGATEVKSSNSAPNDFLLRQNYPNPFNPTTTISYTLSVLSRVSIKVYDVLGREVATLVNQEVQPVGNYSTTFNASKLASGVYICRLIAGNFVQTKKMVLIK
jgi:hypothetical protein